MRKGLFMETGFTALYTGGSYDYYPLVFDLHVPPPFR